MEFTLDNGLRVVHMYDGDTATVVLTVLYDTGARDEDPGQTGMAHLFEHLMFGGSANVPDFDPPAASSVRSKSDRKSVV